MGRSIHTNHPPYEKILTGHYFFRKGVPHHLAMTSDVQDFRLSNYPNPHEVGGRIHERIVSQVGAELLLVAKKKNQSRHEFYATQVVALCKQNESSQLFAAASEGDMLLNNSGPARRLAADLGRFVGNETSEPVIRKFLAFAPKRNLTDFASAFERVRFSQGGRIVDEEELKTELVSQIDEASPTPADQKNLIFADSDWLGLFRSFPEYARFLSESKKNASVAAAKCMVCLSRYLFVVLPQTQYYATPINLGQRDDNLNSTVQYPIHPFAQHVTQIMLLQLENPFGFSSLKEPRDGDSLQFGKEIVNATTANLLWSFLPASMNDHMLAALALMLDAKPFMKVAKAVNTDDQFAPSKGGNTITPKAAPDRLVQSALVIAMLRGVRPYYDEKSADSLAYPGGIVKNFIDNHKTATTQ